MQRSHHIDDPLIDMQKFGIGQRPRIRCAYAVEDILFPARFIPGKIGRTLKLPNRPRSRGARSR